MTGLYGMMFLLRKWTVLLKRYDSAASYFSDIIGVVSSDPLPYVLFVPSGKVSPNQVFHTSGKSKLARYLALSPGLV